MSLLPRPTETEETSLHVGRLGVVGIVFYVVAAAAPLVGMTGALPVAIVLGNGAAVPGAYLAVGIVLLLFSVGYAAMSQRVTNAGAFFAYVGRGLGIGPGVGSAYVSLVAYLAIQLAIYGFFGAVMAGQMDAKLGIDLSWWAWALIAWVIVLGLSAFSVDVGAKVLGVLMLLEIGSLALVSLAVIFQGGGPDGLRLRRVLRARQHPRRWADRLRGHRAGLRLRLLHRLRGHGHLRRGVEGPQADGPDGDVPGCHAHHGAVRGHHVRRGLGAGRCQRGRGGSQPLRQSTASRSPTRQR